MISLTDKARISAAIQAAEAKTDGEIFCVVAKQAHDYPLVPIAWAAALALLAPLPMIYFRLGSTPTVYLAHLAIFFVAALVLSRPALRFRIVPRRASSPRRRSGAKRSSRRRKWAAFIAMRRRCTPA